MRPFTICASLHRHVPGRSIGFYHDWMYNHYRSAIVAGVCNAWMHNRCQGVLLYPYRRIHIRSIWFYLTVLGILINRTLAY